MSNPEIDESSTEKEEITPIVVEIKNQPKVIPDRKWTDDYEEEELSILTDEELNKELEEARKDAR